MVTVHIGDELGHLIEEAAAARGKSVGEFVTETLRDTLSSQQPVSRGERNSIPVLRVPDGTMPIDPANVRRHIEEEGF